MMAASSGTAASPLRTEAARLDPPATTAVAAKRVDSALTSDVGTTTTTPSLTWVATATLRSTTRRPANSKYCLAPPKRVPEPAATITVQTEGRVAIAAGSLRTQELDDPSPGVGGIGRAVGGTDRIVDETVIGALVGDDHRSGRLQGGHIVCRGERVFGADDRQ